MGDPLSATAMSLLGKVIITKAAETILNKRDKIFTFLKSNLPGIRNQDVRFSISYLIRIQIPGSSKYLLVKGNRIKHQFQPVGGVYKKTHSFAEFDDWGYKPDCARKGIASDSVSRDDLRFTVKGKHVLDVIKWFELDKNRESGFVREFREELIATGILEEQIFKDLMFTKIRKVANVLNKSVYHGCYEVLIYDIADFIPNREQEAELIKMLSEARDENKPYILADRSEIEQLRLLEGDTEIGKIGEHTKYLLNEK